MPDGSRYHALDPPDTYFWAHATFFDQALYFADTFVKKLSREEKEQMYLESKTWYRRYGVSDRPMPADYAEFERYWGRMINEVLVAHSTAKYGVGYVTKGFFPKPKAVNPIVWRLVAPVFNPVAAFLTTGGMPPRTREILGLPWSERKERNYQRFAAFLALASGELAVGSSSDERPLQRLRQSGIRAGGGACLTSRPKRSSTPRSSSSTSMASAGSPSTT